jgi:hypothetical protein
MNPSNTTTLNAASPLWTRRTVFVALALLVGFAAVLHFQGRPAWCKYGLALWSDVNTHCTSQQFIDPYSLSHVLHGVIFFWALQWFNARAPARWRMPLWWQLIAAMLLEMGWELVENSPWVIERYRQNTSSLDYNGDSILNSLGDTASAVAGFVFASRFGWKASVGLFVGFELWLLYLARDNLTLNVIMLVYPIDAIRQWQMGG